MNLSPSKGPPTMRLERLQEKLPEAIAHWYVNKGLQSAIKNVGSLREGLTLVVRLDKAIHTCAT